MDTNGCKCWHDGKKGVERDGKEERREEERSVVCVVCRRLMLMAASFVVVVVGVGFVVGVARLSEKKGVTVLFRSTLVSNLQTCHWLVHCTFPAENEK